MEIVKFGSIGGRLGLRIDRPASTYGDGSVGTGDSQQVYTFFSDEAREFFIQYLREKEKADKLTVIIEMLKGQLTAEADERWKVERFPGALINLWTAIKTLWRELGR